MLLYSLELRKMQVKQLACASRIPQPTTTVQAVPWDGAFGPVHGSFVVILPYVQNSPCTIS